MEYGFYNFDYRKKVEHSPEKPYFDERTGFICYTPSLDLEMYRNYLELMDYYKDMWKSTSYLSLGMLPLVMLPSFCGNMYNNMFYKLSEIIGITSYSMNSTSFFKTSYKSNDDIWFFRKDYAELVGIEETEVSVLNLLEVLLNEGFR